MHLSAVTQLSEHLGLLWVAVGWQVGLLSFLSRERNVLSRQHRPCLGLGSALFWVPQGREGGSVGAELQVVEVGA